MPSLGKQIQTKLQPSNIHQFQRQNNCPAPFQTCHCLKIWPKYSYLKAISLNNYNPKQFLQNTRSTQLQRCASRDSEARYENILLNNLLCRRESNTFWLLGWQGSAVSRIQESQPAAGNSDGKRSPLRNTNIQSILPPE